MLTSLHEKVDAAHAALVVIDVQNDFCSPDGVFDRLGLDLTPAQSIVPRVADLVDECRSVGLQVVFCRYTQSEHTMSEVQREQRTRGRSGETICQQGSWGAQFYQLAPASSDLVIEKHRYSAFIGTDLDLVLRSLGIRSLLMTGVASNGCVEATSRDGFMLNYYITFVEDCTANYNNTLHLAAADNIREAYGIVASSSEVIAAIRTQNGIGQSITERAL